ncbi:MAG: hypothetical protein K0S07_777 [Chlamydiales bacterium]|jgi:hypothetical protein|nr:hypothetical protein [Chlamydiales bacterium]
MLPRPIDSNLPALLTQPLEQCPSAMPEERERPPHPDDAWIALAQERKIIDHEGCILSHSFERALPENSRERFWQLLNGKVLLRGDRQRGKEAPRWIDGNLLSLLQTFEGAIGEVLPLPGIRWQIVGSFVPCILGQSFYQSFLQEILPGYSKEHVPNEPQDLDIRVLIEAPENQLGHHLDELLQKIEGCCQAHVKTAKVAKRQQMGSDDLFILAKIECVLETPEKTRPITLDLVIAQKLQHHSLFFYRASSLSFSLQNPLSSLALEYDQKAGEHMKSSQPLFDEAFQLLNWSRADYRGMAFKRYLQGISSGKVPFSPRRAKSLTTNFLKEQQEMGYGWAARIIKYFIAPKPQEGGDVKELFLIIHALHALTSLTQEEKNALPSGALEKIRQELVKALSPLRDPLLEAMRQGLERLDLPLFFDLLSLQLWIGSLFPQNEITFRLLHGQSYLQWNMQGATLLLPLRAKIPALSSQEMPKEAFFCARSLYDFFLKRHASYPKMLQKRSLEAIACHPSSFENIEQLMAEPDPFLSHMGYFLGGILAQMGRAIPFSSKTLRNVPRALLYESRELSAKDLLDHLALWYNRAHLKEKPLSFTSLPIKECQSLIAVEIFWLEILVQTKDRALCSFVCQAFNQQPLEPETIALGKRLFEAIYQQDIKRGIALWQRLKSALSLAESFDMWRLLISLEEARQKKAFSAPLIAEWHLLLKSAPLLEREMERLFKNHSLLSWLQEHTSAKEGQLLQKARAFHQSLPSTAYEGIGDVDHALAKALAAALLQGQEKKSQETLSAAKEQSLVVLSIALKEVREKRPFSPSIASFYLRSYQKLPILDPSAWQELLAYGAGQPFLRKCFHALIALPWAEQGSSPRALIADPRFFKCWSELLKLDLPPPLFLTYAFQEKGFFTLWQESNISEAKKAKLLLKLFSDGLELCRQLKSRRDQESMIGHLQERLKEMTPLLVHNDLERQRDFAIQFIINSIPFMSLSKFSLQLKAVKKTLSLRDDHLLKEALLTMLQAAERFAWDELEMISQELFDLFDSLKEKRFFPLQAALSFFASIPLTCFRQEKNSYLSYALKNKLAAGSNPQQGSEFYDFALAEIEKGLFELTPALFHLKLMNRHKKELSDEQKKKLTRLSARALLDLFLGQKVTFFKSEEEKALILLSILEGIEGLPPAPLWQLLLKQYWDSVERSGAFFSDKTVIKIAIGYCSFLFKANRAEQLLPILSERMHALFEQPTIELQASYNLISHSLQKLVTVKENWLCLRRELSDLTLQYILFYSHSSALYRSSNERYRTVIVQALVSTAQLPQKSPEEWPIFALLYEMPFKGKFEISALPKALSILLELRKSAPWCATQEKADIQLLQFAFKIMQRALSQSSAKKGLKEKESALEKGLELIASFIESRHEKSRQALQESNPLLDLLPSLLEEHFAKGPLKLYLKKICLIFKERLNDPANDPNRKALALKLSALSP